MSMLKVKDLKVNYGGIEALKGISFEVNEGEIVSLNASVAAGILMYEIVRARAK